MKNENMDISNKRDWKLLAIAVTAAVLSMIGANSAFIVGVIAVPSALVAMGLRLLDKQKRETQMKFVAYGSCLLLLVSGPGGCAIGTYRVEKAAEPIIKALEQYRLKHGLYPKKEEIELLLATNPCPSLDRKFYYAPLKDGGDFDLTCVTFGFNKHSYQGSRKRWEDWD